MLPKVLDTLFFACAHDFSWPRKTDRGDYYQVCLNCGDEYGYDWNNMRRIERLQLEPAGNQTQSKNGRKNNPPLRNRSHKWVPRARRHRLSVAIEFREKHSSTWVHAQVENISESGVLVRTGFVIREETAVEMRFEMPEQVSGRKHSKVLCQGFVRRVVSPQDGEQLPALALSIVDYKFLPRPN